MAIGCGAKCSKMILFVFNFVFWGCGVALVIVGSLVLAGNEVSGISVESEDGLMTAAAVLVVAAGVFALVVGFVGCCGAMKESKCLLGTYFTCLLVLCALQITIGILGFVYKGEIQDSLATSIPDSLRDEYTEDRPDAFSESWDLIQQDYSCCGYNDYNDYDGNTNLEALNWDFPKSCCVQTADGKPTDPAQCKSMSDEFFYKDPCKQEIINLYEEYIVLVITVGFIIAAIEVVGMILTLCLCCNTED